MLKFTNHIVTTDTEGCVVRAIGTNTYGKTMTRLYEEESAYEEVTTEVAEAGKRAAEINEVRKELAEKIIREKYSASKEFQIQRRALNLLINPATLNEGEEEPVDAESIIADFAAYNAAVESALAEAESQAEGAYEAKIQEELHRTMQAAGLTVVPGTEGPETKAAE